MSNVTNINSTPVDYVLEKVYHSPFLQANRNRGVVTIRKGQGVEHMFIRFCKPDA